jgi:outer membrane protein assembly factor BamB
MRLEHSCGIILFVGALVACGKSGDPHAGTGSGTPPPHPAVTTAGAPGREPWRIVQVHDDVAIVASQEGVAVLGADGKVLARRKVSDAAALKSAAITPGAIVWIDADSPVLRLLDLATGQERWHVALESQPDGMTVGAHDVAVMHSGAVDLYRLTDGAPSYHQSGPANAASRFLAPQGLYVFVDQRGGVQAVDEATHKQLWSVDLHHGPAKLGDPDIAVQNDTVIVRYDREFAKLDSKSGKVLAHGAASFVAPGPLPTTLTSAPDGGTIATSGSPTLTTFRFNDIGKIVWRSGEWSELVLGGRDATMWRTQTAATIRLTSSGAGRLIGFDDRTGHVTFHRELGEHSMAVGLIDDCALILDLDHDRRLECLDAKTGSGRWARPVVGRNAFAQQVGEHVLLADNSPAAATYLDATGEPIWQLALPDTEIRETAQGTGLITHESRDVLHRGCWHIGKRMLVLPDEQNVRIVSLATGKLVEVKP